MGARTFAVVKIPAGGLLAGNRFIAQGSRGGLNVVLILFIARSLGHLKSYFGEM